jgi:hypothetical protein
VNRARSLLLVSIFCVFCTLMLWLAGRSLPHEDEFHPKHPGKFDSQEWLWLGEPDRPVEQRLTMLDDLRANHLHPGMTALEVAQLLGPADSLPGPSNTIWKYTVDLERTSDANSVRAELRLEFDLTGTLLSVTIEHFSTTR